MNADLRANLPSGSGPHGEAIPGAPSIVPGPTVGDPELTSLLVFGTFAVPIGWVLLTAFQVLDLPAEPFVLSTLLLGLVLPAVILVHRDPTTDGRQLWRDCFRAPRPVLLLVPAVLAIPGLTALAADVAGVREPLDGALLVGLVVNVVTSVLIVNLWEELAWTGFFQRRAMARWGLARGSIVTAMLFAGVHLPLAFDGAHDAGDAVRNVGYLLLAGVGLRLLIAGVDVWSRGSLLTIALLHASFNAAGELVDPAHDVLRYTVTLGLGALVLLTPARLAHTPTSDRPNDGRGQGAP